MFILKHQNSDSMSYYGKNLDFYDPLIYFNPQL